MTATLNSELWKKTATRPTGSRVLQNKSPIAITCFIIDNNDYYFEIITLIKLFQ